MYKPKGIYLSLIVILPTLISVMVGLDYLPTIKKKEAWSWLGNVGVRTKEGKEKELEAMGEPWVWKERGVGGRGSAEVGRWRAFLVLAWVWVREIQA